MPHQGVLTRIDFSTAPGKKPYREPRENANLQNMLAIVTVIPQISGESDWKLVID